jgi:uncharacterized protein (TIGR03067 family)
MYAWPLLLLAAAPLGDRSKEEAAAALKALEGTWVVIEDELDGKKAADRGETVPREAVIADGRLRLDGESHRLRLVPGKEPRAVDVLPPGQMVQNAHYKGIYKL